MIGRPYFRLPRAKNVSAEWAKQVALQAGLPVDWDSVLVYAVRPNAVWTYMSARSFGNFVNPGFSIEPDIIYEEIELHEYAWLDMEESYVIGYGPKTKTLVIMYF